MCVKGWGGGWGGGLIGEGPVDEDVAAWGETAVVSL